MRSNTARNLERLAPVCGLLLAALVAFTPPVLGDGPGNGENDAKKVKRIEFKVRDAGAEPDKREDRPNPLTVEQLEDLGGAVGMLGALAVFERVEGAFELLDGILGFAGKCPQRDPRLGKTVVLKSLKTDLRVDGNVVPMAGGTMFHKFTVEKIEKDNKGCRLWVAAEDLLGLKGWVKESEVVLEKEAKAYFTGVIKREPRSAAAHYQRGSLDHGDRALADLTEAIRLDPTFAPARVALSAIYSGKKDSARALAELTEAIRIDPGLWSAYYERASLYLQKNEAGRAIADLSAAIRTNPAGFMAYGARGMEYYEEKDWARAVADLSAAIRLIPRDGNRFLSTMLLAPYYLTRGNAYDDQEKYDLAIADFTEVVSMADGFLPLDEQLVIGAIFNRANAWYAKEDLDRAIAGYTDVIKRSSGAKFDRFSLLLGDTKGIPAFDEMKRSLDAKFGALGYVGRGRARERAQDVAGALADYAEALRHHPEPFVEAISYIGRSDIESDRNDLASALADCEQAIRLLPQKWFVYLKRAQVLNNSGHYERALADCDKAREVEPKSPWGHDYRAWIQATCPEAKFRDGKKAVEEATLACELTAWKSAPCLETLAAAAAESGDFDAAVKWQSKALEVSSADKAKALFRDRLELFRKKRPYRDVPSKIGSRQANHGMPEIPLEAG